MIESGLELVDSVEKVWDVKRIPDSRTPGQFDSVRALGQLIRHYLQPRILETRQSAY